jgi:hypothetical protein
MSKSNKKVYVKKQIKDLINAKILSFLENGRKEITKKKQLEKYPIGSMISYTTKQNIFRPGGFIDEFEEDGFIYKSPEFDKYRYRVRYNTVAKMWVGDVYKVKNDLVSLVIDGKKPTNFPVKVADIIVYYAKSNHDVRRFKGTDRYKLYMKWCEYFLDKDE